MQQSETTRKILEAASTLFAEQGFSETTMRQITTHADVNLAAVNYHFGSKERLILAVALDCVEPLVASLEAALSERLALAGQTVSLEELMDMLMRSLLRSEHRGKDTLALLMRLLDLAYMRRQQDLRDYLNAHFGVRLQPFLAQLRKDAAPMDDDEFFWRLHFLLGAVIFTLSNYHTLAALEPHGSTLETEIELTLHRMVPVLAGGFQARAETTHFCWI